MADFSQAQVRADAGDTRDPRVLAGVEDWLIAALMGVMALIMAAGIVSRYLLPGVRIAYLDQLLPNLFVWLTMLGVASAARRAAHLGMSALVDRLPPRLYRATAVLAAACGLFFFGFLGWQGWVATLAQYERGATSAMGYPAWWISAAIPVGSVAVMVRVCQAVWRLARAG